jgi:DNA-nicking Smr family endonuclease
VAKEPTYDVGSAQWRRITATVKPMRKAKLLSPSSSEDGLGRRGEALHSAASTHPAVTKASFADLNLTAPPREERRKAAQASGLDASWDRRLKTGRLDPDLHGHNLASAHTYLARALDRAVGQGARVILLVAGKQRGPDEAPRGAIRRELESWLAHSRHAGRIAALRNAHPRHGGAGALYLVLRKPLA